MPLFVPTLMSGLWTLLSASVVTLALKMLAAIGFGVVVYSGIDLGISAIETELLSNLNGLPADMLQIMRIWEFDTGIKIIIAGYGANLALRTSTGLLSRVIFKEI